MQFIVVCLKETNNLSLYLLIKTLHICMHIYIYCMHTCAHNNFIYNDQVYF